MMNAEKIGKDYTIILSVIIPQMLRLWVIITIFFIIDVFFINIICYYLNEKIYVEELMVKNCFLGGELR